MFREVNWIRPGYDEPVGMGQDINAAVAALPGCKSVQSGGDRTSGKTITVSSWDTEEHARVLRDAALADIMPRLQAIGLQLDPPEVYETIS